MRYAITMTVLLFVLFLAACSVEPEAPGASIEQTALYKMYLAGGDTTIASDGSLGGLNVTSDNETDSAITLTIYGYNSTIDFTETLANFNASVNSSLATTWTSISKLVLSGAAVGTVTVTDATSSFVIATFAPGELTAYNAVQFLNGASRVPPLLTGNGTSVDVRHMTEFVLWTDCDTIATTNVSFDYWVSPDGLNWFDGSVSPLGCAGASRKTALTDTGVSYIKLNVTNADNASNNILTYLTYK